MALAQVLAGTTQGHPLVDHHIVAHFRGLTDHNAIAVVNTHPPADLGARMNLDPGLMRRALADITGDKRHFVI